MINVLLIGESKSGKTSSIETLPRGTVLFSFDKGGWHSLGRKGKKLTVVPKFGEWFKDELMLEPTDILCVDYAVSDTVEPNQYTRVDQTLIHTFIQDFNLLWSPKASDKGIFHIAIDSLTSMQRPVLEYVMAINNRVMATQQDWGQAINKVDEIIQSAVGLPFDFILTSHIQAEKDEISGKIRELPLIYGKQLPNLLLAKFDDIYLTFSERTPAGLQFFWGTSPEGLLKIIGTRNFDNLPARVAPNFMKLYAEKLYGGEVKK